MKRKMLLNWSAILLIFIVLFIFYFVTKKSSKAERIIYNMPVEITEGKECNVRILDSLLGISNKFMAITIGSKDCSSCRLAQQDAFYQRFGAGKHLFNVEDYPNNMLLAQAMHTEGFPATYVIDKDYNVKGSIVGMDSFQALLDSVFYLKGEVLRIPDNSYENICSDSVLEMLSYSLKSLVAYWNDDMKAMKHNAHLSLKKGGYFFNNYLLYLAYKEENKKDSMHFHREAALKLTHGVDAHIYKDLIIELREYEKTAEKIEME